MSAHHLHANYIVIDRGRQWAANVSAAISHQNIDVGVDPDGSFSRVSVVWVKVQLQLARMLAAPAYVHIGYKGLQDMDITGLGTGQNGIQAPINPCLCG